MHSNKLKVLTKEKIYDFTEELHYRYKKIPQILVRQAGLGQGC